jgi:hypothetical protein
MRNILISFLQVSVPNGMNRYSIKPNGVTIAILAMSERSIGTCKKVSKEKVPALAKFAGQVDDGRTEVGTGHVLWPNSTDDN